MKLGKSVKFSIITVCFNAEKVIRPTMESVLRQDYENFEYIIVDGASTDGTVAVIQEYAGIDARVQWRSEPDDGVFNAMNKGVQRAQGDFLLFLNAGDEFHSADILQRAAEIADGTDVIIGDVAFKRENGLSRHIYPVGEDLLNNLKKGESVCHQVIFAAKDTLTEGFDERYTTCADYDWICRQVNAGRKIIKLNAVVVDYDISGITFQTKYQKIHWKEYFEVIGKHFPRTGFPYGREVKQLFVQKKKEHFMYEFMNRWLMLKQQGISLSLFFAHKKIKTIAIYGVHNMGQRLYDELQNSGITVKYGIDRSPQKAKWGVPVLHPDEALEMVDAVVITPIFDFLEIRDSLSVTLSCPMFSIEEVLFYEYEHQQMTEPQKAGNRDKRYRDMMDQWLILKQERKSIADYLAAKGYRSIAIYGMAICGRHVIRELQATDITIVYGIDRNKINPYMGIEVRQPVGELPCVDAIVNTAIFDHANIQKMLAKLTEIPVVSLEDVIFESYSI
ncbi:MAG: glycosyltransferase [Lachnospiraceae bacterium]|nr:glycosyltransferase [Lachnospiraceae bacterium]